MRWPPGWEARYSAHCPGNIARRTLRLEIAGPALMPKSYRRSSGPHGPGSCLVGQYHPGSIQLLLVDIGPQHIQPVSGRLLPNRLLVAGVAVADVSDSPGEVLRHLVLVDDPAHPLADGRRAPQCASTARPAPLCHGRYLRQLPLRGRQHILPLALPLLRQ